MSLSIACAATSFLGGFAIFSILGNMAHVMQKTVDEVVESGNLFVNIRLYIKSFFICQKIYEISFFTH